MTDVFVRPRPGLILAEVPAAGAAIPEALAEEWIANRMVVPATAEPGIRRRLGAVIREAPPALVGESGTERVTSIQKAPVRRRRTKRAAKSARRSTR